MELIATYNHKGYGDTWVGMKGRDEKEVRKNGKYHMQGTSIDDLAEFLPPRVVTIHFTEDDVKDFVGLISY